MKEPRKDEETAAPKPAAEPTAAPNPSEAKPPAGLNYVFKIAKADPKNSFDFEDVADK